MPGKILLFDDVITGSTGLRRQLVVAHYDMIVVRDGEEAVNHSRRFKPDLVLINGEPADMRATELCRTLKADPTLSDIPVVLISDQSDLASRIDALRAGASEVYRASVDALILLARLRSLLRAAGNQRQLLPDSRQCLDFGLMEECRPFPGPALVGLIAGSRDKAADLQRTLSPLLDDRFVLFTADTVMGDFAARNVPDVFVLDAELATSGDGLRLFSELRSRPGSHHAAVCLVSDPAATDAWATALDLGIDDVIEQEADAAELALRIQTQIKSKRRNDSLRTSMVDRMRQALFDPLTGLFNRRYALPALARIAERASLNDEPFAILLADIDQFKHVNDTYGHAAGDNVLVTIANRLRDCLRPNDLLARIGGEEFLIALPELSLGEAHAMAERLRLSVCCRPFYLASGDQIRVTISIGLAMGDTPADAMNDFDSLISAPDTALLDAKAMGRNRVTIARTAA
ncbi:MAG: diguanylate cyclase [Paracoccaceae bacterium]